MRTPGASTYSFVFSAESFVTTFVDVTGIVIYFSIAKMFLL